MSQIATTPGNEPETQTASRRGGFGGHPPGLTTLFFTEMWERFSYYGMRALLVLFMTAAAVGDNPGLGFDRVTSTAIYGLYTSMVYLLTLPGGWVADNLWGQKKAVFVGGCIIAAGHFSMAIPMVPTFYAGLVLISLGTGLLKPNVSTMVADLYPEGGARRDAGFSIFYMGINLGAILGTTLCSFIGEGYNFHWGFSLAGTGMVLGLIQYRVGDRRLGDAGLLKTGDSDEDLRRLSRQFYGISGVTAAAVTLLVVLGAGGIIELSIQQVATWLGYGILIMSGLFFLYLFTGAGLTTIEKRRVAVIVWLWLLAAIFWSGFEQAGSSMTLFARDSTDRNFAGWEMPVGWLQNVNPVLIVIFAPVFGWLWTWLATRKANPSTPLKFALGLFGLAAGFFVLSWGAANAGDGALVSPAWLVVTYFLHTVGELCLSPVGLSSVTKLAPAGRVGQMMGVWFIAAALGNLFAGLLAGSLDDALFWNVALTIGAAGVVGLVASPFIRRWMDDIE